MTAQIRRRLGEFTEQAAESAMNIAQSAGNQALEAAKLRYFRTKIAQDMARHVIVCREQLSLLRVRRSGDLTPLLQAFTKLEATKEQLRMNLGAFADEFRQLGLDGQLSLRAPVQAVMLWDDRDLAEAITQTRQPSRDKLKKLTDLLESQYQFVLSGLLWVERETGGSRTARLADVLMAVRKLDDLILWIQSAQEAVVRTAQEEELTGPRAIIRRITGRP